MKRRILTLTLVFILVCLVFSLSSCGECEHSYGAWETKTGATCVSEGVMVRTCTKCGESEDGVIQKTDHSFTTYVSDDNATCTTDGTKSAKCDNCSATDVKPLEGSKKPHSFTIYISDNNATCSQNATETATCDREGCSATHSVVIPDSKVAHVLSTTDNAPSCTDDGAIITSCANCNYSVSETVAALGHDWSADEPTCEEGIFCSRCEASLPPLSHKYELKNSTDASCDENGLDIFACSVCGDEYSTVREYARGHVSGESWTLSSEHLKDGETCIAVQIYTSVCSVCSDTLEREEEVEKHVYTASIKTAAACNADGVKLYTCTKGCGDSYEESYSDAQNHKWGEGTVSGKITTYTCSGCAETKKTVSSKEDTSATVDKGTLEDAGEVELKDASIALDADTLSGLSGDVSISADKLGAEDIVIPDSLKDAIGERPIYNFGMKMNGNVVSAFDGLVTVRVPYALANGEDPECIAVWYIDENGEIQSIRAAYSDGYAIFETNHFSYYTVTRLTPEERCALYNHSYKTTVKAPGCTTEGYTLTVCQRCGESKKINIVPATGHSFTEERVEPTCTVSGSISYSCEGCGSEHFEKLPATGHNYSITESTEPTCTAPGRVVSTCANCLDEYVEVEPKIAHSFEDKITEATCITSGHRERTCSACGYFVTDSFVEALGHNYTETVIEPTCLTDGYTLHKCERCSSEYSTDVIAGAHSWDLDEPTCGSAQTCLVCGAKGAPATGEHNMENGVCTVCGQGCQHNYTESIVSPSCTKDGYTMKTCTLCGATERTNVISATGHKGSGTCTVCGASLEATFYDNMFDSLFNGDFVVNMTDFYYGSEVYSAGYYITVKDIYYALDDEGEIISYGSFSFRFESGSKSSYEGDFYISDGKVYAKVVEDGDKGYIVTELDKIIYSVPASISMIEGFLRFTKGDLADIISIVALTMGSSIDEVTSTVCEWLFNIENKGDGKTYSLNFDSVREINDYLYEKNIADIVDLVLGEGKYESFGEGIEVLLGTPLSETAAKILESGMAVADAERILDAFVSLVSVGEYDGLVELIKKDIEGDYETLSDFLKTDYAKDHKVIDVLILVSDNIEFGGASSDVENTPATRPEESLPDIGGDVGDTEHEVKPINPGANGSDNNGNSGTSRPSEDNANKDDGGKDHSKDESGKNENDDSAPPISYKDQFIVSGDTQGFATDIEVSYGTIDDGYTVIGGGSGVGSVDGDYSVIIGGGTGSLGDGYISGDFNGDFDIVVKEENVGGKEEEPVDPDKAIEDIMEYVESFGKTNVYEYMVGVMYGESDIALSMAKEAVDKEISRLEEKLSFVIKTDLSGNITEIKISISDYRIEEADASSINGSINIIADSGNASRYENIKNEALSVFASAPSLDSVLSGYDVTRDDKNIYASSNGSIEYMSYIGTSFYKDYYEIAYERGVIRSLTAQISTDDEWLFIVEGCNGRIHSLMNSMCSFDLSRETIVYRYSYSGELLNTSKNNETTRYSDTQLSVYKDSSGKYVLYPEAFAYGHEYEYDHSSYVAADGCLGYGERHFECKDCARKLVEYFRNGHDISVRHEINADSCEDGYVEKGVCTVCGELVYEIELDEHSVGDKEQKLTFAGMCDHHNLIFGTCVCGEYAHLNYNGFDYVSFGVYTCNACGFTLTQEENPIREGCVMYYEYTYTIKNSSGKTVFTDKGINYQSTSHDYKTTVSLLPGAESCEDGIKITKICKICNKSSSYDTYWHEVAEVESVDISGYGIDGSVAYCECACGVNRTVMILTSEPYEMYSDHDYYTIDGMSCNRVDKYTLKSGLSIDIYYCTQKTGCEVENYRVVYVEGTKIKTFKITTTYEHVESGKATLSGDSCEDGVVINYTCVSCGNKRSASYEHHYEYYKEIIVLDDYGSVCGGMIGVRGCACGENKAYLYNNMNCETDSEYIYWNDSDNYFYVYTCAVTSPACGFRYGIKYYTEKDGCFERYFVELLIGCDENGENARKSVTIEIRTEYNHEVDCYKPGDKNRDVSCSKCGLTLDGILNESWIKHTDFISDRVENPDGTVTNYYGYCNDCGIGYYDIERDKHVVAEYSTEIHVYKAVGYEITTRETRYIEYNGEYYCDIITDSRVIYMFDGAKLTDTRDKGSETEEYLNFFEDGFAEKFLEIEGCEYDSKKHGCIAIVFGVKHGDSIYTEDVCKTVWGNSKVTCTQDAESYDMCAVCGKGYREIYDYARGHEWHYDRKSGAYFCQRCGLESANGADGAIVLEDLTHMYGNGSYYVVGYKNSKDIEFITSITIILENGDELLIEGIEFTHSDTGRLISFSREAVESIALKLGYKRGQYEIRISFVPVGSGTDLDYAITFN